MKNTWVAAGLITLGAISFSSCSLEPYVITAEEQYMRDFIKKFGLVDAEQDWNMAKSEDIRVNVGAGVKHLKLYVKVGQKYYLIADYYDVEGTFDIPVDVPEDTKDILAIADGRRYYGTIGTTIDCTGTGSRASGDSSDNFPDKSEITSVRYSYELDGQWIDYSSWDATLKKYTNVETWTVPRSIETRTSYVIGGKNYEVVSGYLPEVDSRAFEKFNAQQISPITSNRIWRDYFSLNGNTPRVNPLALNDGLGLIPEDGIKARSEGGNINNAGIIENFTITAKDGSFAIYPMYWNTSQTHELGVYLYGNDGNVLKDDQGKPALFPIFQDKRIDEENKSATADLYVYNKGGKVDYNTIQIGISGDKAVASIPRELLGSYFGNDNLPKGISIKEKVTDENGAEEVKEYGIDQQAFKGLMHAYLQAFNNSSANWSNYFSDIFSSQVEVDLGNGYRLVNMTIGGWGDKNLTIDYYFEKPSDYPTSSAVTTFLEETGGNYGYFNTAKDEAFPTDDPLLVKNRAYFVYLPDGIQKVGMYIRFKDRTGHKSDVDKILYSESKYNDLNNGKNNSFACSFLHPQSGRTFFSFEDWTGQYSDKDLNDLLFRIADIDEISNDTDKITEISDEPISWIWAVEDLGSTDDFDFNDIVMKIESVSTNIYRKSSSGESTQVGSYKKVTFTPLAAGGTLPTYIHWKKSATEDYVLAPGVYVETGASTAGEAGAKPLESLNGGTDAVEYHQWFGDYSYTHMLNTGQTSVPKADIKKCVIYVNSKFSIDGFANKAIDGNGKGLYISINGPSEGENTRDVDIQKASDTNYNVSAPEKGAPAQMFIILDNNWAWPIERTHINLAYPRFKDWVTDKSLDWTKERGAGQVVNR